MMFPLRGFCPEMLGEHPVISAEIVPVSGQGVSAARELQKLGFRVFSLGATISIQGDESLWTSVFGARFKDQSSSAEGIGERKSFRVVVESTVNIPQNLKALIQDVAFIEPPEFFG